MRPGLARLISCAVFVGQLALLVFSLLPIWNLYRIHPDLGRIRSDYVSLWSLFWNTIIKPPRSPVTASGDMTDILLAGIIFGAGSVIGFSVGAYAFYVARQVR